MQENDARKKQEAQIRNSKITKGDRVFVVMARKTGRDYQHRRKWKLQCQ